MAEFGTVFLISLLAAGLTWLGAPLAEAFDVPQRVVGRALQFAAGVITALVAVSLMPEAVRNTAPLLLAPAFFFGGAVFIVFDYVSATRAAARAVEVPGIVPDPDVGAPASAPAKPASISLFVGILVDLVIDGAVIGIGATVNLATGLLLALGMAISTLPLAFVTIATAKRQGMPRRARRILSLLFVVCVVGGAMIGFLLLRNAPLTLRFTLVAFASGFLMTTVTQTMIPEANRDGEPSLSGLYFVGGLSLYALLSVYVK